MKVLFTSDLDRTLIFSERTKLTDVPYACIEHLDERAISYVSMTTKELLIQLHTRIDFVPVTTRSYKQYERLLLFQSEVVPKLAVVANGGIILRDGVIDQVWQQRITQKMMALPLLHQQLQKHFLSYFTAPYVLRMAEVDELFFVLIVDVHQFSTPELLTFREQLETYEWTCYLQGRKLYVMPQFLTKGAAVSYIKEQSMYDWHVAAGDSMLDVSMLTLADTCFIPQHAELAQHEIQHGLPILNQTSSHFSDACLQQILEKIT